MARAPEVACPSGTPPTHGPAASRLALGVSYDGGPFFGFQAQARGPTVQGELEAALGRVAAAPVRIVAAGRTDSGVHASLQVVHFDPPRVRPLQAWLLGTNRFLSPAIAVGWVRPVAPDFHARFSALGRRYRYRIVNRATRPVLDRHTAAWIREPLDAAAMHLAAQALVGEHDFSSFRAAGCQARHPVRRVDRIDVRRRGERLDVVIEGNAFLHHMVRNIVGTLLAVGHGRQAVGWPGRLLALRDRTRAEPTAPACGLTLEAVRYPARFGLPSPASGGG